MKQVLNINSVNDYVEYVGAEVLHSQIGVIHYDELQACRHSLNNYEVYGLFIIEESPYTITYGQGTYDFRNYSLLSVAPGQMGGVSDNGEIIHLKGWVLLFSPQLLVGTPLAKIIDEYHFFSYYQTEALHMENEEWKTITNIIKIMRNELRLHLDAPRQREILTSYLQLILEYCSRFYLRQFQTETEGANSDLLKRFNKILKDYYKDKKQIKLGIPTVKYCAQELFLSPNYFGDLIRQLTGDSASHTIRKFVLQYGKTLLNEGKTVSETARALGFSYPQHFTRMFKKQFGFSPTHKA